MRGSNNSSSPSSCVGAARVVDANLARAAIYGPCTPAPTPTRPGVQRRGHTAKTGRRLSTKPARRHSDTATATAMARAEDQRQTLASRGCEPAAAWLVGGCDTSTQRQDAKHASSTNVASTPASNRSTEHHGPTACNCSENQSFPFTLFCSVPAPTLSVQMLPKVFFTLCAPRPKACKVQRSNTTPTGSPLLIADPSTNLQRLESQRPDETANP